MTDAQAAAILEKLEQHNTLLTAILAELQSWRAPAAAESECPHPETYWQDLSTMGNRHIRCGLCGGDVLRKDQAT